MENSLQGKVVLITGGARRVGAAIGRRLHASGASLMIHFRNSEKEAASLQEELSKKRPGSVSIVRCDLLETPKLLSLVEETVRVFGRLDVLVNNASSFYPTTVGEITENHWEDLVGSNLKAPLFLSQAAATEIKKNKGCIVNIADIHAERPLKNYPLYCIAKAGLVGLTRSLAMELGPEIRVNAVAPGPILWPEAGEWSDQTSRQMIVEHTFLKKTGKPDDIAGAVNFLIYDAPYVTGQVIAVDGGRSVNL